MLDLNCAFEAGAGWLARAAGNFLEGHLNARTLAPSGQDYAVEASDTQRGGGIAALSAADERGK